MTRQAVSVVCLSKPRHFRQAIRQETARTSFGPVSRGGLCGAWTGARDQQERLSRRRGITGSSTTVNHWRDISGNFSQTKISSKELAVTVRNMDAAAGEFEIEWYFFGKPAGETGRFLYDKGSKKVSVAPGASQKIAIDSKELSANTIRDYYYYGYNYTSGYKADGWVIRVKGSNPLLEQTAQDPAGFGKITKSTKKTHK